MGRYFWAVARMEDALPAILLIAISTFQHRKQATPQVSDFVDLLGFVKQTAIAN
jgi:hypothetical protein